MYQCIKNNKEIYYYDSVYSLQQVGGGNVNVPGSIACVLSDNQRYCKTQKVEFFI